MGDAPLLVPKADLDQVKAFHAFCLLGGDLGRTAVLMKCTTTDIESLSHDFNWRDKITGLVRLDTDEGKNVQREVHRVGVYLVAEKAKKIVEDIITRLGSDEAFAESMLTTTLFDREGAVKEVTFNAKSLLDLIKSLQAASDISYRALGDDTKVSPDSLKDGASAAAAAIATYQALTNRFDKMKGVDHTAGVGRVLKDVTP